MYKKLINIVTIFFISNSISAAEPKEKEQVEQQVSRVGTLIQKSIAVVVDQLFDNQVTIEKIFADFPPELIEKIMVAGGYDFLLIKYFTNQLKIEELKTIVPIDILEKLISKIELIKNPDQYLALMILNGKLEKKDPFFKAIPIYKDVLQLLVNERFIKTAIQMGLIVGNSWQALLSPEVLKRVNKHLNKDLTNLQLYNPKAFVKIQKSKIHASQVIKNILNAGVTPFVSQGLFNPMHLAILQENIPLVELLLQYGDIDWYVNNYDETPLLFALRMYYAKKTDQTIMKKIIELLLKHGSDVTAENEDGDIFLMYPYLNFDTDMFALINMYHPIMQIIDHKIEREEKESTRLKKKVTVRGFSQELDEQILMNNKLLKKYKEMKSDLLEYFNEKK